MTIFNKLNLSGILSIILLFTLAGTVVNAGEPKESILNNYETQGFQCLNISDTVNEDTLKSYTDLVSLENSDMVHVCIKTDMDQVQIAGNKYVFVFDRKGSIKAQNRIASILD